MRTGLVFVAKRTDTDTVWVLSNNPAMPYYEDGPEWDGNKKYKLESLIRASTAAPFLFTPTHITIHTDRFGNPVKGCFVDGGVTPHNNPALLTLLMAALPAYRLEWVLSPDDLLLISVGTGTHRSADRSRPQAHLGMSPNPKASPQKRKDIEEAAFATQTLRTLGEQLRSVRDQGDAVALQPALQLDKSTAKYATLRTSFS